MPDIAIELAQEVERLKAEVKLLRHALQALCDSCDLWVEDLEVAEQIACPYEAARALLGGPHAD